MVSFNVDDKKCYITNTASAYSNGISFNIDDINIESLRDFITKIETEI